MADTHRPLGPPAPGGPRPAPPVGAPPAPTVVGGGAADGTGPVPAGRPAAPPTAGAPGSGAPAARPPFGTPGGAPPPPPPAPGGPVPGAPPSGGARRLVSVVVGAALLLAAGTGGALIALALDDDADPSGPTSLDASPTGGGSSEPDEALAEVADAVLPSVVSITVGGSGRGGAQGGGSGVLISEDGLILTNNHVAAAARGGELTVTFADGETAEAEVVGTDPASDLAVIEAQDVGRRTPATLGSSADLNVGDTVLAIGSPLGLEGSVTSGIVSAVNRSITLGGGGGSPFGGGDPSPTAVINAIQTDAAINPGNSGGALINSSGEVVGINTAIASLAGGVGGQGGNIGLGFAIPIDDARDVADQLIETGEATHAYLGVRIADGETGGALVGVVESGSPAEEAGLAEGDVVTAVDGEEIADATGLTAAVRALAPGDEVEITYSRDGEEHTAQVTLGTLSGD